MVSGINEELSAFIDGELSSEAAAHQLARLKVDPEARIAWETCQVIGDALRGHDARGICGRVVERLATEPTVISPRQKPTPGASVASWAMSLAAGAAAVALVIWTVMPSLRNDLQIAQQETTSQMPAPVAPQSVQITDYLLAHQRYSAANAMQGVAPYVRTVAYEGESR